MFDSFGIQLRAGPLSHHIDVIVLEVLGDSGNECDANRRAQEQRYTMDKLRRGVIVKPGSVPINDVPENERVQQRKDLINRR